LDAVIRPKRNLLRFGGFWIACFRVGDLVGRSEGFGILMLARERDMVAGMVILSGDFDPER
jgi:hypothetical protein